VEFSGLHVIAQKADGGLRDALSMFDQIVSFSGGTSVTYESVIENLNVLDYDYYFKITDYLQAGNFGEVLVLFDTILSKGFEGWSFLVGMGEHFRNLLVCQDAVTVNLLEVSAGIRSRYHSQSQQWNPVTLIRCLDVISKTDQALKSSKNQRLTIELGLLNLSSMFHQAEKKSPDAIQSVNQIPINPPLPSRSVPSAPEERKQVISFKGSVPIRTVSISKHLSISEQKGFQDNPLQGEHSVVEDLPAKLFTEEALIEAWKNYTQKIQTEGRKSMFASLTLTKPSLSASNGIVFQVQNESQLRELEFERTDLLSYLRKEMDNFSITLEFVKAETPFKDKPFTSDEKLKVLEERNPHVSTLLLKLGLKPE
jgi:DNA polymerase-3 subunit gamma/tau